MRLAASAALLAAGLGLLAAGARAEPGTGSALPQIAAVQAPACLRAGAELTVQGTDLGSARKGWTLQLGGMQLEPQEWSEQSIRARVPASLPGGAGAEEPARVQLLSQSGALLARSEPVLRLCHESAGEGGASAGEPATRGIGAARAPLPPVPGSAAPAREEALAGELLLAAPDLATAAAAARSAEALGLEEPARRSELRSLGFTLVQLRFSDDAAADSAAARLRELHPALRIVPNRLFRLEGDAHAASSDARAAIGWPQPSGCGQGRRIGMIDTALDVSHPELAGRRVVVRSMFAGPASAGSEPERHGTAVASLLVGRSVGLVPQAQLFAASAFWAREGEVVSSTEQVLASIDWLLGQQVAVINLSLTGPDDGLVADALRRAHQRGVAVVAAAGNGGPAEPVAFPARLPEVVAVTAIDLLLHAYPRASRGAEIDLAAPGVDVPVAEAEPRGGLGIATGTSYAAPFVSAALALQPLGLAGLLRRARDLGSPGRDPIFGWGALDAAGLCAAPEDEASEAARPAPPLTIGMDTDG